MRALCLSLSTLLLAACGGSSSGDDATTGMGTLRLALADAPACGYDSVHVTVDRVRLHTSGSAPDSDAGWSELVLPSPQRIDLLTLTNGVLAELGQTLLVQGRYTQLRLVLAPNTSANPLANAVTPSGAAEVALDTPSATGPSGLKIPADITVEATELADFIIDFDACQSVVRRGNSGAYGLKPVLRLLPRPAGAGHRVVGFVDPALAGAAVSVQSAGVPLVSTVPDPADGRFELYPVPVGSVSLVISAPGRATGVVSGVPVTADAPTAVNAATSPITLADGVPRVVTATVTASPEPEAVQLRVQQQLGDGTQIQVLALPAAGDGTPVDLTLPSVPPQVAAYVAGATGVLLVDDESPDTVGRYSVQAHLTPPSPALPQTKSLAVDIARTVPDPLPALAFDFP